MNTEDQNFGFLTVHDTELGILPFACTDGPQV